MVRMMLARRSRQRIRIVDNEVWLRAASMAEGYWRDGKLIRWLMTRAGLPRAIARRS